MLRQSLDIYRQECKTKDRNVSDVLNSIATTLIAQGFYREALDRLNESLEIDHALLGTDHADVACTLANIGSAYEGLDMLDDAKEQYEAALKINRSKIEAVVDDTPPSSQGHCLPLVRQYSLESDLEVAKNLFSIGSVLLKQDALDEGLGYFDQCLRIEKACLKTDRHPDIAKTLKSMADILVRKAELGRALEM